MDGELRLKMGRVPQRETAFRSGELGELTVGAMLDKRAARRPLIALHDRRMPRGHRLAIAAAGVFVIDAKQYRGRVRVEDRGFRGPG